MKQLNKFFWLKINFKDGDGDGTGGDGGEENKGDEGGKGGKDGVTSEQFDKLTAGVTALAEGMTALQESTKQTNARMDELAKPPPTSNKDDKPGPLDDGGASLEEMSRPDFANAIIDKVVKAVDERIGKVSEAVEGVRKDTGNQAIERDIEKLEAVHKDFWEWQSEIKVLAAENPGTSIARLYTLAKNENPEKLAELDKKYKDDKGGDKSNDKSFGGLTPTSSTTEDSSKMDKKSAADKAFDDTMGHFNMPNQGNV